MDAGVETVTKGELKVLLDKCGPDNVEVAVAELDDYVLTHQHEFEYDDVEPQPFMREDGKIQLNR